MIYSSNIKKETMLPHERFEALLNRERPDRVPFIPFMFGFAAGLVGCSLADMYGDAEKCFQAQVRSAELLGHDGLPWYGYGSQGGWEFGGEIKMPHGEFAHAPSVKRFPAPTPELVEALVIPDVETAGAYPVVIELAKIQQQHGLPISVFGFSPFTAAGNICDIENMCRWMRKCPEVVHLVMRKCTDFHKKVIDYFVEKFPGHPMWVFLSEPTSSNNMISPKDFEEFSFPYVKEAHEYCLQKGIRYCYTHICGDQNLNLPLWAEIPYGDPGLVSFGHEVDLNRAIELFGDKNIIAGNVEPSHMQVGPAEKVYQLSKEAIEKGKYSPSGYVLMAGCGVPPMAPPYNVFAMRKAVLDHGFYE
jgi:uroporphyrinogen decarboxylase